MYEKLCAHIFLSMFCVLPTECSQVILDKKVIKTVCTQNWLGICFFSTRDDSMFIPHNKTVDGPH